MHADRRDLDAFAHSLTTHAFPFVAGKQVVEEVMTMPFGLDPALEEAIEKFQEDKKARERRIRDLEEKAAKGGVKGVYMRLGCVVRCG